MAFFEQVGKILEEWMFVEELSLWCILFFHCLSLNQVWMNIFYSLALDLDKYKSKYLSGNFGDIDHQEKTFRSIWSTVGWEDFPEQDS